MQRRSPRRGYNAVISEVRNRPAAASPLMPSRSHNRNAPTFSMSSPTSRSSPAEVAWRQAGPRWPRRARTRAILLCRKRLRTGSSTAKRVAQYSPTNGCRRHSVSFPSAGSRRPSSEGSVETGRRASLDPSTSSRTIALPSRRLGARSSPGLDRNAMAMCRLRGLLFRSRPTDSTVPGGSRSTSSSTSRHGSACSSIARANMPSRCMNGDDDQASSSPIAARSRPACSNARAR